MTMTLSYVAHAMSRTTLIYALEGFRDARRDNLGLCLFVAFMSLSLLFYSLLLLCP